ncbi:hypothetical protein C8R44DRAFT_180551 [Mycena epipterygia]|nr:hypothetical protein C8R44DRAFT_180551 [Mycena epipterygia]
MVRDRNIPVVETQKYGYLGCFGVYCDHLAQQWSWTVGSRKFARHESIIQNHGSTFLHKKSAYDTILLLLRVNLDVVLLKCYLLLPRAPLTQVWGVSPFRHQFTSSLTTFDCVVGQRRLSALWIGRRYYQIYPLLRYVQLRTVRVTVFQMQIRPIQCRATPSSCSPHSHGTRRRRPSQQLSVSPRLLVRVGTRRNSCGVRRGFGGTSIYKILHPCCTTLQNLPLIFLPIPAPTDSDS